MPRLLDLFCGAGGAAMGYHRAGFDVTGVDIKPQPHYPFPFILGDALEYVREHGAEYDAIHASPPCQAYSRATAWRGNRQHHPRLIADVRSVLHAPFVIENVQEARGELMTPLMLCGTSFGLPFQRHRFFEIYPRFGSLTPPCHHSETDLSFDHGKKQPESVYRDATGCGWMTVIESRQAIPPAYTEWIGKQLIKVFQ